MELMEKTVERHVLFEGAIVTLRRDKAQLINGQVVSREVVEHPGGVAILPLYHRPAALRELEEEVGVRAGELIYLGYLYTSPGFSTEVLHMYLARDLEPGVCHPDDDEFLECERIPFDQLVEQVVSGVICDAKTVALVLKAKAYLGR